MNIGTSFKTRACVSLISLLIAGASAPALGQSWPPTPIRTPTLYSFDYSEGGYPNYVTLLSDSTGALYGTTYGGGAKAFGVVFKLSPPAPGQSRWTETVLYSFSLISEGLYPYAGLVRDSSGALYGVASFGGTSGLGVAFKLAPPVSPSTQWTYSRIYDFAPAVGGFLHGALTFDGAGALIGAASGGGSDFSYGTVYKLTPPSSPGNQWTGVALYTFAGGVDGSNPMSTLVTDTSGAIYGTTPSGGGNNSGVVFKLTPPGANCTPVSPNLWCKSVLYSFTGGSDGGAPSAGLTLDDSSGTFYGTTRAGGLSNLGVAFSLSPPVPPSTQWRFSVLHSFGSGQDGAQPVSPLTLIGGALYGMTNSGGGTSCFSGGCGTLFQLTRPTAPTMPWSENILYRFNGADGSHPQGGLTFSVLQSGLGSVIYGVTTDGGGLGFGTVFGLQCGQQAREVFGGAQHVACAP